MQCGHWNQLLSCGFQVATLFGKTTVQGRLQWHKGVRANV